MLGPVLFLVFINDLDQGIASSILKFADDTKLFEEVRHNIDCEALQIDLMWSYGLRNGRWNLTLKVQGYACWETDCCEY